MEKNYITNSSSKFSVASENLTLLSSVAQINMHKKQIFYSKINRCVVITCLIAFIVFAAFYLYDFLKPRLSSQSKIIELMQINRINLALFSFKTLMISISFIFYCFFDDNFLPFSFTFSLICVLVLTFFIAITLRLLLDYSKYIKEINILYFPALIILYLSIILTQLFVWDYINFYSSFILILEAASEIIALTANYLLSKRICEKLKLEKRINNIFDQEYDNFQLALADLTSNRSC